MSESRSRIWVYVAELATALSIGLAAILLLLWLLKGIFPEGTGLGELVRSGTPQRAAAARVAIDGGTEAMIAVLTEVENRVMERPASSVAWSSARRGYALGDRHAIQTQANSRATIEFDEETVLELEERSVIVVRKPRRLLGSGKRLASVIVSDGFLRGRVGPGADDVQLEVLAAGATVRAASDDARGAAVEIRVEEEGSAIAVQEGRVELDWGAGMTLIPAGFMVTRDSEGRTSEPLPLPAVPRALAPVDGQRFTYRASPPKVKFDWRAQDQAREFRLEIARDPAFLSSVYDERLGDSQMIHENLEVGTYYWRVSARQGPLAGSASEVRKLTVLRDDRPPSLTVRFPDGPVDSSPMILRGQTEPGCRVFIGDVDIPVAPDGSFEYSLTLRDGYNFIVVQAVDAHGNTAFGNHTILARIEGQESSS